MSEFLSFDEGKAERFVVLPAGRQTCLMCNKKSREGEVIKLTKRFKVRLCPKCWKEYKKIVKTWADVCHHRKL